MKYSTRKILASCVALAMVAASTLLAVGSITGTHAQSSLASGISSVTDFYVPGSFPWGTAFDSGGRVWVAMPGCDLAPSCSSSTPPGKLALYDPNARNWVAIVSLPAGYGQPVFVAIDQSGKVWFTMPVTNSIGLYDPVSKTVTQWAIPTPGAGPWDLAIDSKGTIWFTEHYGNQIGSFDPNSQTFHEVATPASNSNPYGITVDASDNIWFTENTDSVALIGEYTNQGILNEYKIRNTPTEGTGLTPHLITIDPNGNVWWTEGWVSAIGMLNVAAAQPGTNNGVTEYQYTPSCGSCGSHSAGISADKQGLIWLDDSLQNTFGSFPIGGGAFSFYNTPPGGRGPLDGLNVDSQNRVWFDEEFSNKLAVAIQSSSPTPTATTMTTATATSTPTSTSTPTATATVSSVTDFYVPGSFPWGTAFDNSGRVWVAMPGCDLAPSCPSSTPPGKLALYDPNVRNWVAIVSLPAGYGQPVFVAVDQSGKVWFTMPVTNSIGLYDPVSKTVAQWAVPTPSAGPWDLAIDSKGTIWFTEHYGNQIGSFDPNSQTFHEVATPASNSNPYGITVDASDNIWFTENTDSVALIGEYTNQGILNEYKIRNTPTGGTGLTPHLITIDPNGNVWWTEGWVSAIGMLNVAAAQPGTNNGVTEYQYTPSCSSCGSYTAGISADKQGLIWLDDSLQNTFGSFPIGGGAFSFYNTPPGGRGPLDGLNVDSQNRVWFDEEFSNKLAVAIQSSSPTPTATTTTTATATSTPTSTSTPTATATPGTVLGTDSFQRANQSLWGIASDGQTWGGDANINAVFSISGNAGVVSNTGGTSYSAVLGPTASNAEVYATGSISSFTNSNFGDVLRWTDGNNWYKAFIDGSSLILQKKVSGTTSILASVPFPATAGVSYTIHFRVVGSTLTANVWAASGSEPSGWMVTASDSTFTSGFCGMRFLTQSGAATVTSFQANSL